MFLYYMKQVVEQHVFFLMGAVQGQHTQFDPANLCLLCLFVDSILPQKQGILLGQYLGAFNLMDTFKGRNKKQL